ncbi:MAG: hypothetical protein Q8R98_05095 [Rubrivivax sp.]|nr:hypothetical protein [Rubrivivax sp.]MDP3611208.1 hypothetical protein [Rubrivivax sp.]
MHHHHNGAEAPHIAAPNAAELNSTDDKHLSERLAHVAASLASNHFKLLRTAEGPLLVVRWGRAHDLRDVDAAEAFARRVGAMA